ncbi:MAG: hypothetical protein U5L73_08515 [Rhodoferax sp.]|uniref:hypothetical protein n=1 Tax=Rhodoferax sp. TaxID=50421 RepID=UPI002ACD67A7|nr:hypothetical protein [Rhodoferax sp.]MDZ7891790.1 hypothetical protein [Rhodoferax sp.]
MLATDFLTLLRKLETGRPTLRTLLFFLWRSQIDSPFAREPRRRCSCMRQSKNYDANKAEVWAGAAHPQVSAMHPTKPAAYAGDCGMNWAQVALKWLS